MVIHLSSKHFFLFCLRTCGYIVYTFDAIQKVNGKEKKDTTCPFCLVFTVDCRLNTKASEKPQTSAPCPAQTSLSSVSFFISLSRSCFPYLPTREVFFIAVRECSVLYIMSEISSGWSHNIQERILVLLIGVDKCFFVTSLETLFSWQLKYFFLNNTKNFANVQSFFLSVFVLFFLSLCHYSTTEC